MAEKRNYDDSSGENVNCILAKHPKIDEDIDPLCTSVNNQDLCGHESGSLDSGNKKDPLSDLTKDQCVVLYTLFLCMVNMGIIMIDDEVSMGDIDFRKIVKELENKGLVESYSYDHKKYIPYSKQSMIIKSYRENCLLGDIDKDFFIQVASDKSIETYAKMYCLHGDGSRESEDSGPITTMRLIVEGRGHGLPDSVKGEVPVCLIDNEKEFDMFVKFWCKARDTDPITLSDQIPDEKIKNFYSAFTILSEIKNEIMEMHLTKKKWSILISTLISEKYSVCEDITYEKRKNIQQTFKALQEVQEEKAEEDLVFLKELELRDELLTLDKENNKVSFVSEEVRHQVMGFFVLNCLQSKENYEDYLNLSSLDSLIEYVRPLGYTRQSTERCMYLPKGTEEVFVRRFGIDAIYNATPGFYHLKHAILSELKLPPAVLKMSKGTRNKFCNFVKGFDEEHEHHYLNRSSLLGSFLIELNTSQKREFFILPLSSSKMSILCTIMLSENYTICLDEKVKDKIKKTVQAFRVFHSNATVEDDLLIKELVENDKVLTRNNALNTVQFAMDDVRHHVMSYFARTCLVTDEDYITYIKLSSVDSLLEYICEWGYEDVKEKRCLHLPKRIENTYVERLDVHMLCHVNPKMIRQNIRKLVYKLNIPKEVLKWDYDARCRYVACAKKGTQTMHRARAMIVGCAGAGKTTLLRRLQQRSIQELRQIQSTVGLEVHDNLFEVDKDRKCLRGLEEDVDTENKCLLSVVDFAGQCAYYACHQVYLSRRAFYLLVIDMSKRFDKKVDQALCEQEGTMFADWTFGQYVIFWLKSIHTYCEDDTPVVTIATHSDEVKNMVNTSIYDDLLELLKNEPDLRKHLDRERCFHIGFPKDDNEPLDKLTDLVECIASISLEDRWREKIPKDWAYCEVVLRQKKQSGEKCISLSDFRKQVSIEKNGKENKTFDVLQFYHDIGVILYYNEDHLKHSTITDVQWFVDCFKYIITDPKHARDLVDNDKDWKNFFESGYLSRELLKGIWMKKDMEPIKCNTTLKYMQRLGLLAKGKKAYYVPCMNKLDFEKKLKDYITKLDQKTSVLVFNFRFLPYFFYFRLIVACIVNTKWTVIEDNGQKCLFKNIALFKFEEHMIGVAVTTSTIQVQIFKQGNGHLKKEITMNIKQTIEDVLENLTKNFHKKTLYDIGYQCSKQDILEENATSFILEKDLVGRGEFSCPNHGLKNHHVINENDLLRFWRHGEETSLHDKEVQIPKTLYRNLITDLVNNYLDKSVDNERVFRTWKEHFKSLYSAPRYHSTTVYEDFNTLEKDGKLSLNNYEILKEILKNVDHRALQRIKEHEEELKRTLCRQKSISLFRNVPQMFKTLKSFSCLLNFQFK
ncbi:uncharacterized protein LOC134269137 isoform X1 [Saccostrea cucullata]|uniref:uncharacterized protein LOC134269137 isoform X1 n=1 Tax=Saccostrea cuccullata TaxID=36930 RepID=UPI002ED06E54